MKLTLKSGKEFEVASVSKVTETQIVIGVIGLTSIDELTSELTEEALSEVTLERDEDTVEVYNNHTNVINPVQAYKAEDGTWEVAVRLEKLDGIALELRELKEKVAQLEASR